MLNKILDGILPFKPVRFLQPPKETYAVTFDDITYRGADNLIAITDHSLRIEVYADVIDTEKESMIEERLVNLKLEFEKGERIWLESEQMYMTPYYISYTTKNIGG